jgi:hypothetical protein
MLFTRLFNWIKYKTLPPSVLFLNRLFVERDSKHRRVTSNLGLTFRNSKWSTYARTNINLSSRTSYVGSLLKLIMLIGLVAALYNLTALYNLPLLTNTLYSLLWFVSDSDLYLKVVFSSSLFCTWQLTVSQVLSRMFNSSYDVTTGTANAISKPVTLPKRLHKPILHAWLTTGNSFTDFEKLFDGGALKGSSQLTELYPSLYRATYLVSKSSESANVLKSSLDSLASSVRPSLFTYSELNDLLTRSNTLFIDYSVFESGAELRSPFFSELDSWTLSKVNSELASAGVVEASLTGQFYLPSYSYSNLNAVSTSVPELSHLRQSVSNQLSLIQWNRWLYKYNILHRSILKASSVMTLSKRLLSSGFYSSSLSTNNLWASSALASNKVESNKLASLHRSIYGDFTGLDSLTRETMTSSTGFMNESSLKNLKFYEVSYHWFIQRFYNLNNLSTNIAVTKPSLSGNYNLQTQSALANYTSSATNFSIGTTEVLKSSTSLLDLTVNVSVTASDSTVKSVPTSDLYLAYNENTLFTKHKLEVCQNLLRNSSFSSNQFFGPSKLS